MSFIKRIPSLFCGLRNLKFTHNINVYNSTVQTLGYQGFVKDDLYSKDTLMEWCTDNVLYEDDNLIGVNKPAWVPQFSKNFTDEQIVGIDEIIPQLQERWNTHSLDIVLPFSRFQSGVMLFTKTKAAHARMKQILQTTKIQKQTFMSHIVLTVGHPSFEKCIEETMFFRQLKVDDKSVTITIPKQTNKGQRSGEEIQVQFNSQILSVNRLLDVPVTALQIQTNRDKWHCIEVYLTRKLCCVLGDHRYSGRLKQVLGQVMPVKPFAAIITKQTIPKSIGRILQIQNNTADSVPLHIHRHKIELLQFPTKKSEPIVINAPLPEYFLRSLQDLELYSEEIQGILASS